MSDRDAGTVLPLLVLGFLLGAAVLAAATAGSAALVARRELAATCDGAALAAAAALDRTTLTGTGDPGPATVLPLDRTMVTAVVEDYVDAGTEVTVRADGGTVTVRCRRSARVPFGAVLGRPHGIERTAVSRARSRIRPST